MRRDSGKSDGLGSPQGQVVVHRADRQPFLPRIPQGDRPPVIAAASGVAAVALVDVDGDLDLDLAIANNVSHDVSVLLYRCDPCPSDLDGSGDVGFTDMLAVLAAWGPCAGCLEDLDGDAAVGFTDLRVVLSSWGPSA